MEVEEFRSSLSILSNEACSMALINIDICIILLSEGIYFIEGCDVSVHREHSVSDDDSHPC